MTTCLWQWDRGDVVEAGGRAMAFRLEAAAITAPPPGNSVAQRVQSDPESPEHGEQCLHFRVRDHDPDGRDDVRQRRDALVACVPSRPVAVIETSLARPSLGSVRMATSPAPSIRASVLVIVGRLTWKARARSAGNFSEISNRTKWLSTVNCAFVIPLGSALVSIVLTSWSMIPISLKNAKASGSGVTLSNASPRASAATGRRGAHNPCAPASVAARRP